MLFLAPKTLAREECPATWELKSKKHKRAELQVIKKVSNCLFLHSIPLSCHLLYLAGVVVTFLWLQYDNLTKPT